MGSESTGPEVYLVAAGHAHPPTELTSAEVERSVPGVAEGWLESRMGIASRRVLAHHESLAELGVRAVRDAAASAAWQADEIDALVGAVSFVDDVLPATASMIARDLSTSALAFDVNAACASFPYGLAVAQALMISRPELERVAVCAAERPTVWSDYEDRDSSVYWGDSAGCALLQTEPASGFRLVGVALANDNAHAEKVRVRHHGTFHHDGRYSYEQVVRLTDRTSRELLDRAGLAPSELVAFVGHQSNIRLLREVGEKLGVDWERQWHNVEWAGNQAGAGVATAFSAGWRTHDASLRPGDHVLLAAVGGGYSAGAALLQYVD